MINVLFDKKFVKLRLHYIFCLHSLNVERQRAPYSINNVHGGLVQQTADYVDDKDSLF